MLGELEGESEMFMRTGEHCPLKKPSADAGRIFPVSENSGPDLFLFFAVVRLRSSDEELEDAGEVFLCADSGRLSYSFREGGGDIW